MKNGATQDAHILIVDDDIASRSLLAGDFKKAGHRVSETEQTDNLQAQVEQQAVDLVLLNIDLPGKDGLTLTRELRAHSGVGIILLTSKEDEIDRIVGLEMGADDYVTKPFNPRELLVRARNLLRRIKDQREPKKPAKMRPLCRFEGWELDPNRRLLTSPDQVSERLSEGEFKLLHTLASNPGQVLSRDQLMDAIRDRAWFPRDRSVDVLVGRIRRKLRDSPSAPHFILTAHGAGYLFAGNLAS